MGLLHFAREDSMNKYFLACFLALFGCASSGRNFNQASVQQLQTGVTTEEQAIKILGSEPTLRTYQPDGSYMALWQYAHVAFVATVTDNKAIDLLFDKNKIFQRVVSVYNSAP